MELSYLCTVTPSVVHLHNKKGTTKDNTMNYDLERQPLPGFEPPTQMEGLKHLDHSATATLVSRGLLIRVYKVHIGYTGDVIHPLVKNHHAAPSLLF